jgi:hypothetical protein
MADVTGQFGQEDIVLNNAATEATLKQILAAMKIVAASSAKDFKSQEELEKSLGDLAKKTKTAAQNGKKFTDSTLRSYKAQEQNTDAVEDNTKAYDNAVKSISKFRDNTTKAASAIVNLIGKVSSAADTVRGMDGSVSSAVGALGQIPMGVGDVIKGIFGPVAGAVDQTHQAFLEASSVGANFGGNMRDMLQASAAAGLNLGEMNAIVKSNSEALMMLGGNTADGAKRLLKLGKDIRDTPLAADLARLGYSTSDINEGFADYSKMLAKNGRLQGMTDAQLMAGTHAYLKNLDAVSKLTGKSKEALQAEEDARQADAQYRIMMSKLDADGQAQMENLMKSIPAQHQAGLKEILATGTATSEAGVQALAFLKESGMSAQQLHQQMNATGTLTADQVANFNKTYQAEADALIKSPLAETLGKFDPAANDFIVGVADVAARTQTLEEVIKGNEDRLNELKNTPPPDLIDPDTVQSFKQNINDKALQMTEALASVDLSKLETVFNKAADLAIEYLPKAVNLAAENFELVAGTVLALNSAALLASAALKGLSLAASSGMIPGGPRGNKKPGSSGAGANTMKNAGKGVLRRFAPFALALSAYEGYQGYSAANEKLEAGEITSNEATVEKSEAIGSAVGGGGGALAGAAAGAAIGSVVPIVGTAIGGLIGGAIGYWAGSKGGEMLGEQIGNVIAGEDTMKDLEAQIAEEQARIDRSMAGENEYWGSEASGIEDSQAKIEQMRKDLELVRKRTEELKAQEKAAADAAAEAAGVPAEATSAAATEADAAAGSTTSTTATNAQKSLEQQKEEADKKAAEEAKKKEEEALKKQEQASDDLSSAVETKKSPEEVMLALNNNIEELVNLTRMSNALTQKHIGVTTGLTNDAFSV